MFDPRALPISLGDWIDSTRERNTNCETVIDAMTGNRVRAAASHFTHRRCRAHPGAMARPTSPRRVGLAEHPRDSLSSVSDRLSAWPVTPCRRSTILKSAVRKTILVRKVLAYQLTASIQGKSTYQALAAACRDDTLVVPKLDRLSRSVPDARHIAARKG